MIRGVMQFHNLFNSDVESPIFSFHSLSNRFYVWGVEIFSQFALKEHINFTQGISKLVTFFTFELPFQFFQVTIIIIYIMQAYEFYSYDSMSFFYCYVFWKHYSELCLFSLEISILKKLIKIRWMWKKAIKRLLQGMFF